MGADGSQIQLLTPLYHALTNSEDAMRLAIMALAAALAVSACGGDGSGPGQEATRLAFTAQPSTSTAGQVIVPPVEVSVQDASGNVVSTAEDAVTLGLAVNPGGATLGGTTTVNAAGGVATFSDLQLSKPGTNYSLSAAAPGLTGSASAAFDVSPMPGVATRIAPVDGDGQAATVGQSVAIAPAVKVVDGFGDPVANVGVTFSASPGATVTGAEQATDAAGVARVGQWTLGTVAGMDTLFATAPALDGSPVRFTAAATAGPATTLVVNFGEDQKASPGSPVVEPPSVIAKDAYGNPVAGVTVTFTVTSGGGSITGPVQTTADNGAAFLEGWTLGPSVGPNTLTATADGLAGSPITFTAMATIFAASATVEVRDNYFSSRQNGSGSSGGLFGGAPAVDTIAVGGTVTWTWVGANHNVTAAFASANTSGTHDAPFTYSKTFSTPTNFNYRCTNHSQLIFDFVTGMRGVIVVR
jgi:plastocyanin